MMELVRTIYLDDYKYEPETYDKMEHAGYLYTEYYVKSNGIGLCEKSYFKDGTIVTNDIRKFRKKVYNED